MGTGCGSCGSTTYFYSNGNGTYDTVTTYSQSTMSSSGNTGGNHGGSTPPTSGSCPAGYTLSNGTCIPSGGGTTCPTGYFYYAGACYPSSCSVTSRGVSCTTAPPVSTSCPAGETLYGGSCYASSSCTTTSSGKGGSSTSCSGSKMALTCPAGYTQAGSMCYPAASLPVAPAIAAPTVSITAKPNLVRSGESTHLTWDGGNATECAITGTDGFSSSRISDNTTISNVTERRTYTITCDAGGPSASASTTVNILPVWQEI